MNIYLYFYPVISYLISFGCYRLLIPFFRKKDFVDIPISRSAHRVPVPTGGGIVFFIITLLSTIILRNFLIIDNIYIIVFSIIPITILSFVDDFINIKIRYRLLAQVITSIILIAAGNIYIYSPNLLSLFTILFLILVSTTIINVANFMDGIDGLLAGSMILVIFTSTFYLEIISPSICILLGSLLGFLFFNRHPAKIFMGDVGSIFLGCIYAGIAFLASDFKSLISIILLGTPLFADSLLTILWRLIHKENIFTAHKIHLFQRLLQAGWNQRKISNLYILSTFLISLSLIIFGFWCEILVSLFVVICGFTINKKYALDPSRIIKQIKS